MKKIIIKKDHLKVEYMDLETIIIHFLVHVKMSGIL